MKAKTLFGLLLSFSLFFSGCGNSNSGKIEFDKSKDYKPDEVKKIVFHDKQTDELLKLVSKKLSPEEAAKFKRSILLTHRRFGAKAEGKTIGELFDLKLTREEVLKIKFDPNNYEAAYEAVELSELTDKEKKAFEVCVRGYDPRKWAGKTIGEMLGQREADKKVEQSEQKAPATSTTQQNQNYNSPKGIRTVQATELINRIDFIHPVTNPYANQTIAISAQVKEKFIANDGRPMVIIYAEKTPTLPYPYRNDVKIYSSDDRQDIVTIVVDSVQTLNKIPQNAFIKVTGKCSDIYIANAKETDIGYTTYTPEGPTKKVSEKIILGDRIAVIRAEKLEY